ncbi:ALP1-like protein isoform X1 [Tanacetum coccineum]
MSRELFTNIVEEETLHFAYFRDNINCTGREGFSSLMKCISAIRELAYDTVHDAFDEYLQVAIRVSQRKARVFQNVRSLDYIDWEWFGFSNTNKGQYVRRDHGLNRFILLEAVASQDLGMWHAFFGVFGANYDVNIIHQFPLFNVLKDEKTPEIRYAANGVTYRWGYYLVDGIYPK